MSINTLLSNSVILNDLIGAVSEHAGSVNSVSGTAPIVVAPTAGNCVVSLPIAGTWSATHNVVKGSSSSALEWGTDASGAVISVSLPLVETANNITLPIAGTWSATDNVVKGSSATALVWGTDVSGTPFTLAQDLTDYPMTITSGTGTINTGNQSLVSVSVNGKFAIATFAYVINITAGAVGTSFTLYSATALPAPLRTPNGFDISIPLLNETSGFGGFGVLTCDPTGIFNLALTSKYVVNDVIASNGRVCISYYTA